MAAATRIVRTFLPGSAAFVLLSVLLCLPTTAQDEGQNPPQPAFPLPIIQGIQGVPVPADAAANDGPPNLFATDRVAARRLKLAEDRIADGVYDEAVELLQAVLDAEEDSAAPVDDDSGTFQSLKRRALGLLSDLPADARRVYEIKYGVAARGRLEEAVKTGDWEAVEAVSRRFFHTAAGQEATYRLATRAQDRGEALHAALLYARLSKAGSEAFEPRLSLRATAAWMQAGMPEAARSTAEQFAKRTSGQAIEIGGTLRPETADPGQLLSWLAQNAAGADSQNPSWPIFGRDVDRTANIRPVTIANGLEWLHRFNAPTEWDSPQERARAAEISRGFDLLSQSARRRGDQLIQPAFHPIVAGDVVVLRTLRHIQAVDVATGKFLWHTERPHDRIYDHAIEQLGILTASEFEGDFGVMQMGAYFEELAWRNATTGLISTDGRYVYGIEGTGRPQSGGRISVIRGNRPVALGEDGFNTLYAYDLAAEGRIAWTAGGPPSQDTVTGQFFLGAPLPLGGRLYSLIEEDGVIRLVAMDPSAGEEERILWSQTLLAAERPLRDDSLRRISGLSPAFADGILVCPTGAGAVVAVDLSQQVLLWGYQYQRSNDMRLARVQFGIPQFPSSSNDEVDRWLDAIPRIADGHVFLTPRDSDELHCLDLDDGRRLWTQPRSGMLYVGAVYDGKAVMIGRRTVTALDVATGEMVWESPLGEGQPSGHGVASGDVYHLPLDTGKIATIHLSTGQILARSPLGDGIVPGNLLASQGRLLFQSATTLGSFCQADEQEAGRQEALPVDASPEALALRGEDRLHRGEAAAGLADLRRAVDQADLPRAKRLLVAAMLDGLRTDFAAYRQYEADLLELADDPRQRAQFLRLFADGLYDANDPLEAIAAYLRLADGTLPPFQHESVDQQWFVRADRIIRVRLAELDAAVSQEERPELDAILVQHADRLAEAGDTIGLERLASLFLDTPYGRQALQRLARLYQADQDSFRLEQTQLRLQGLTATGDAVVEAFDPPGDDPSEGAAAVAVFDRAYRGEFLPDEIKSGRDVPPVQNTFEVPVFGASPHGLAQWRFAIESSGQALVARDGAGRKQWKLNIASNEGEPAGAQVLSRAQIRFSGHLMAVVAGMRLIVVDLLSDPGRPSVLWSRDLTDRGYGQIDINRRMMGNPASPYIPIGFAGRELLLYQIGNTVTAADPATGDTLWKRHRMPYGCELTGDRDFIVLQPLGSLECLVLRAGDGEGVAARETGGPNTHVAWQETQLITWQQTEGGWELVCQDIARQRELWSGHFPKTARRMPLASGEIAILDVLSGQFQLVRPTDGQLLLQGTIHPDPLIDRFLVMRTAGRWLLFTRHARPGSRIRVEADRSRFPVDGLAYAFDDAGRRLWSSVIERQYLSTDQPPGLPFLFLTARHHQAGERSMQRGAVLDVRTGELLVERERAQEFMPFETAADSSTGVVSIRVPEGRFLLAPGEIALPPPRSDGPEGLRTSG